jgi:hypothetical protein
MKIEFRKKMHHIRAKSQHCIFLVPKLPQLGFAPVFGA